MSAAAPSAEASPVRVHVADGVATVILDRPDAMNAVTTPLAVALEQALRSVGDDQGIRVVVIRGAGGNFCAGGDFDEVQRLRAEGPDALRKLFQAFRSACAAVGEIEQPVIAAVEGVAMAGGFELMQACDIVLVRHDARISDNHVNFGMVPGGGGSQRLPRIIGRQRALGLLLSGDRVSGVDAMAWGIAYRSYAADSFDDDVETFARRLAGRRSDAVRTIKRMVDRGLARDLDAGLDLEMDVVVAHIAGEAGRASASSFVDRKRNSKERKK